MDALNLLQLLKYYLISSFALLAYAVYCQLTCEDIESTFWISFIVSIFTLNLLTFILSIVGINYPIKWLKVTILVLSLLNLMILGGAVVTWLLLIGWL